MEMALIEGGRRAETEGWIEEWYGWLLMVLHLLELLQNVC